MPVARLTTRTLGRAAVVLAALAVAAALTACSSDSTSPAASPTTGASASAPAGGTPAATAPAALPTSSASPIDPASLSLKTDSGPYAAYTIGIPDGWSSEDIPVPGGFGRRYSLLIGGARTAQVTVVCEGGGTIDSLTRADSALIAQIGGTFGINGMRDVTVGGLPGKETQYTVPLSGTTQTGGPNQETRVLYLQGKDCGWHILLQTFGTGMLQRYTAAFDAVIATFKPVA